MECREAITKTQPLALSSEKDIQLKEENTILREEEIFAHGSTNHVTVQ